MIRRPSTAFPQSAGQKRPRQKSPVHLDWLRTLPCVVTGQQAEAAHIRFGSWQHGKRETGMGERPDDKWCVPLSPEEHRLGNRSQHTMSERRYWNEKGIDPVIIAALLWAVSGDTEAGQSICLNARIICAEAPTGGYVVRRAD